MFKKISIVLVSIGMSSAVFAGSYKDQVVAPVGVNLIAPDSVGVWSMGLEALYMAPTNADFQYASVSNNATPTTSFNNKSLDPEHDWGGTIDVAYLFPGQSRDVKLSYTRLHLDDSHSTIISAPNVLSNPFNIGANDADDAVADSDYDYDAVDLVFGQWVRVGERVDLHPFGGLRWANIDMDDTGRYSGGTGDAITEGRGKVKSEFEGIGPRAGLDTAVHVGAGISIVGTVGASLLIGDINSKITTTNFFNETAINGNVYKNDENAHVIPELDARLGVNYTYHFNPGTALGVELGYQAVNYFDVADKDFIDATTPNTINNSEDFGYHGPYLRAQLSVA